jgi:hypothetical protein
MQCKSEQNGTRPSSLRPIRALAEAFWCGVSADDFALGRPSEMAEGKAGGGMLPAGKRSGKAGDAEAQ